MLLIKNINYEKIFFFHCLTIAYIQYGNNNRQLALFDIRQSLFLMLCALGIGIASMFFGFIPYIGWMISLAINVLMIGFFVLWVMGLVQAINGEKTIAGVG